MGFFKKIKKQFKRSVKKIKKQIKRKPTFRSAQEEVVSFSTAWFKLLERTAEKSGVVDWTEKVRSALDRSGLPPEMLDQALGPAGALLGREPVPIQRAQPRTLAEVTRGPSMGFFSSLGTSLLDLGKGLVTDVVAPTIGAVLTQEVSQLTQRALGISAPRQRAAPPVATQPAAFIPPIAIAAAGRRILGPAQGIPSLINPAMPPVPGFAPPVQVSRTGGSMIPGVRVEVPRFARSPADAPMGSQKLQPVLLPDGTVGFIPIRKRRRMNVLNPRALNRAVRRVDGFTKFVKRARGGLRKLSKI